MSLKKIVLITTGQPSCNPRIVKEADALCASGFDVTVLYCFFIDWAEEKDINLLKDVPWKFKLAGGSPNKKKLLYFFTRIRCKIAAIATFFFDTKFLLPEKIQARAFTELYKEAKRIKADWFIAHNLGALPVAVRAAQYHKAKAGFDFEDYYRGEIDPGEKKLLNRNIYLENKYIPFLNYYSTSSEMITEMIKKNHSHFKGDVITLLNCFPLSRQPLYKPKIKTDNTLQLFWFSQTIGANRGLEILIEALVILNDTNIHLTLAGRCNNDMYLYFKEKSGELFSNIHFAGILDPDKLAIFASTFDVGMAIEPRIPENRNICLTNKIFTYLLAGNAIILSETDMQLRFNQKYLIGECFKINNAKSLAEKIKLYQKDTDKLNRQKAYNFKLANEILNWEKESQKLLSVIS